MKKSSKVYIAGHRGLVGSAIWRAFEAHGYTNLVGRTHTELDLIDQAAVDRFFAAEQPEYVVLVAAKVGGIHANATYRGQFIYENLMIQNNVVNSAYKHDVAKLLFLGSSCIYPKHAPQPIKEEALLTGPLEPTNEPYAIAKIAGIRLCDACNRQYSTNFISAMPTNMYGPGDNYHPQNSHVLPAIIRKIHLAHALEQGDFTELEKVYRNENGATDNESGRLEVGSDELVSWLSESGIKHASGCKPVTLTLWGSGRPLREFLYSDDLAEACVFLMQNADYPDIAFTDETGTVQAHINIGSGIEHSIREIADIVKEEVGFAGELDWDTSKPDGTPRKLMDSHRINSLGWSAQVPLREGIRRAYEDFRS